MHQGGQSAVKMRDYVDSRVSLPPWGSPPHLTGRNGEFPLSRYFYVRMHVHFACVNKIEATYEVSRVNGNVKRGSTSTFTSPLFYLRT